MRSKLRTKNTDIKRRAKYIIIELKMHPINAFRNVRNLRIAKKNDNYFLKHDHVEFIFEKERIIYNDPRRFAYFILQQILKITD